MGGKRIYIIMSDDSYANILLNKAGELGLKIPTRKNSESSARISETNKLSNKGVRMALHDEMQELMVLTMEECGELIQACSKSLRKDNYRTNQNLNEELGDVYTMIQLMHELDIVSWEELDERVKVKRKKLKTWSRLIVID